ncbi:hypothetical protein ACOMHN_014609 [Nucella lapillus]
MRCVIGCYSRPPAIHDDGARGRRDGGVNLKLQEQYLDYRLLTFSCGFHVRVSLFHLCKTHLSTNFSRKKTVSPMHEGGGKD